MSAEAIAAAIANAIKASGVVIRVRPEDFANILRRVDSRYLQQGRRLYHQTSIPDQLQGLRFLHQNL